MRREILTTTLQKIITECGYTPYTGFEYRINSELKKMPAVWILPPRLIEQEGRNQGVKHYEVKINIVVKGEVHTQVEREQQWATMEQDATKIACALGNDQNVRAVTKLKCQPEESTLTNRGELSFKVSFIVELPFCNK